MAMDLEGVGYVEVSTVAMVLPWQAMGQSRHGHHGGTMADVVVSTYPTPSKSMAMATLANGLPWHGRGDFGD